MTNLVFKNPWILAPMAGVSEMPFRVLARQFGASQAPTELISAKGLIYGQARTERYMRHDVSEADDFWVQLFGGDADSMVAGGLRAVELGARVLDINMGCPVKKVTQNGAGSALLCDVRRAAQICEQMVRKCGVPVTVKIRAGWDHDHLNYLEMGKALQESGCSAIALHARTRAQGYSGFANWDYIRELAHALTVPVIGNGDANTPEKARQLLQQSQCAAVMIGRGALGNPWIFAQLADFGRAKPTQAERWQILREHLQSHLDFVGCDRLGIKRFRSHLMWYSHGLIGASAFRAQVMTLESLQEVLSLSKSFFLNSTCDSDCKTATDFDERCALG